MKRLNQSIGLMTLLVLSFSPLAFAESEKNLETFYRFYKAGQYQKAADVLILPENQIPESSKSYLLGLAYAKLQEYDKASEQFKLALSLGNTSLDLNYEYGQSLYAANSLKEARKAFLKSAELNFNKSASLYYVAHISQILEEFEISKDYYTKVIKEKSTDVKIKQISFFQLGETLLSIARLKAETKSTKDLEDLERRVEKFILPMMNRALNVDTKSQASFDIKQRISEIMEEFKLDPNTLINGRRISPVRHSLQFSQKIKFDDNISLANEENNVTQTRKESYIFESELYAKYDFVLKKRFIISPEGRITFIQHSDQNSPEVYQNDSLTLNANLKNKYEHKINDKPASLLFDLDYSRISRDWKQRKQRDFYASSVTFMFGESFSYFNFGDTTFKYKRKNYTGDNTLISNNTNSFSFDQTVFIPIGHLFIVLFEASFIDNFNNQSTNTDTYLTRFDYLIPEIFPSYTLGLGLATTLTDTLEQEASRGFETTINPSFTLSKDISSHVKAGINYDFTKNKSKSSSYSYNKHVLSFDFTYKF